MAVVGAKGFIGSALVGRLKSEGLAVSTFTREVPFVSPSGHVAADVGSLQTVFWLAGSTNPAVAEARPDLVAADEAALAGMLSAVAELTTMPRVVLVSSGGTVYDPAGEPPFAEDSALGPVTAYGRTKLRLERALQSSPVRVSTIVRVSNAYGPGQRVGRGQGVIAHWLHAAAQGEPLVLLGDPETARDFVFVDDLADALVRIHRAAEAPPVVNVGAGEPTSLGHLQKLVLDVVGESATFENRPARGFDTDRTWLDVRLAGRALGWRPTTPLRDGIASTWASITRRGDAGGAAPTPGPPARPNP